MNGRALYIAFFLWSGILLPAQAQKHALRQPGCLLDPGREVKIDQVISARCPPQKGVTVPWVVYSNRGDDFGRPYYVVEENLTHFHVVSGTGCSGLTIVNPKDHGFRPKSEFLFHFSAGFTPDALIHRKCVVLNSQGLIDSICRGLMDESRIPVYADPYVRHMQNYTDAYGNILPRFLPLYSIYFIYQAENGRYLLGRDYKFEPSRPFADQVIGWVDAHRVFDYNNRLCFEPEFGASQVRQRRCDTVYGNAKVFATASELDVFLNTPQANIEPFWEEPPTLFLKQPGRYFTADTFNIRLFRSVVGKSACAPGTRCFLSNFTNTGMKADFFRFPYLGLSRGDRKTFQVAATGRYIKSRRGNCDSLTRDKYNLNVCFLLPDSLAGFYAVFFLNQLNEKYAAFKKSYHACFYQSRPGRIAAPGSCQEGYESYEALRDTLISHRPGGKGAAAGSCFVALDRLLDRGSFNSRETNLIILINTRRSRYAREEVPSTLAGRMAGRNIYLMSFDFADNTSFNPTADSLAGEAALLYAKRNGLSPFPAEWQQKGNCRFLVNYLLAGSASLDTAAIRGPQILGFIQSSYDPLLSTVSQAISASCSGRPDTLGLSLNETRFRQGLEKIISGCSRDLVSMRILKKGFTRIKYRDNGPDIWKAEVIMTENELHDLITRLDGFLIPQTGSTLTERICDLWQTLIGRFIGQTLLVDNAYLDLTICQIINRIIGSGFGYDCNEPIKRFTLRDICQGQENVMEPAGEYLKEIAIKKDLLKQKYNSEYFHIGGDAPGASTIRYYWVPVSLLP